MQATILRYQRWYLVLVSAFFLTACGSGSGSGSSTDPVNSAPPPPAATPEISGVSPQSLAFELRSGEMGSATLSFTNSGDAALAYELSAPGPWFEFAGSVSGTLAADSSTSLSVNVSCGSADLSGDVMLSSNDADEGSLSIPVRATFMPIATNLAVERVLMNQGARAFDSNESDTPSVEVVAGREMVVRAFVTGSGPSPDLRLSCRVRARQISSWLCKYRQVFQISKPPKPICRPAIMLFYQGRL